MQLNGFIWQIFAGTLVTLKLAGCALIAGLMIGLLGALCESMTSKWVKYTAGLLIFVIRGLPEILVLFFIYFGATVLLTDLTGHYFDISAFTAGVTALAMIFGAYASQVFRGAFLAIDHGQVEAGRALGLSTWQIFKRIQVPQAWRHALPGIGNLWLVLLKDTAIVTLIGLTDMMNAAKVAASTTRQPFTYFMIAAGIYLLITQLSQLILDGLIAKANRYTKP